MNTHLYAGIRFLRFGFALGVFAAGTSHAAGQAQDYPIAEVPVRDVKITGGFWLQRLDTHFSTTLGHVLKECKETRRLDNFAIAAGVKKGEFKGASFNDSDVYKTVEGRYDRFGTAQRLPKAWRLLYRDGADWKPVVTEDPYGLATDSSNTVHFAPVKTDALRLEADLQEAFLDPYLAAPDAKPSKFSAGILE